ncbi:MAG TPA: TIR domain-containing protein [bacterium]|nr:TIR domain-containing protein [bacterium]
MPPRVFLSHVAEDVRLASSIAEHIKAAGVSVYTYEHDPQPGRSIADKIKRAIANSDAVVVLLTRNSQSSAYVQHEVGCAEGMGKPILPIASADYDFTHMAMLQGRECILFDHDDVDRSAQQLVKEVARIVAARIGDESSRRSQAYGRIANLASTKQIVPTREVPAPVSHPAGAFEIGQGAFLPLELARFKRAFLSGAARSSRQVKQFFLRYPKFLGLGGYVQLKADVTVDAGTGGRPYRVDFCRRMQGDDFWDFVIVAPPQTPVYVNREGQWRLSDEVISTAHQAQYYAGLLESNEPRRKFELTAGIMVSRPRTLLVCGRRCPDVDAVESRVQASRYQSVDVRTYDDIYSYARESSRTCVPIGARTSPTERGTTRRRRRSKPLSPETLFVGEHHQFVDAKGRIAIPVAFRKAMSSNSDACLVVMRGANNSIECHLAAEWNEHAKTWSRHLNLYEKEDVFLRRVWLPGASEVSMDQRGRIHMPKRLLDAAGVSRDATLLGMGSFFEVWSPVNLAAYMKAASKSYDEDLLRLRDESLGDQ